MVYEPETLSNPPALRTWAIINRHTWEVLATADTSEEAQEYVKNLPEPERREADVFGYLWSMGG